MTKTYTAKQAAALLGVTYHALRKQLDRDSHRLKRERCYPHAFKTECCGSWLIPAKDITMVNQKHEGKNNVD